MSSGYEAVAPQAVTGVYLDHQATDRPRPEAVRAVAEYMNDGFGNPSAVAHERGRRCRQSLEKFRNVTADVLGARGDDLLFTSGATESNNLVIASEGRRAKAYIVVSSIEHKCVLESARRAQAHGARVEFLPVTSEGLVCLNSLEQHLRNGATFVSIMAANNEIGTIQPLHKISILCRQHGARLHTDAAQIVGKLRAQHPKLGADYVSFTAHKFGGPQGIGALVCSSELMDSMVPLLVGGSQERGLRPGTTPVALCAGMAAAAEAMICQIDAEIARMGILRERLLDGLLSLGPFFANSSRECGLCNNINGGFEDVPASLLMRQAPQVHFSIGSACTTGTKSSHVLRAIGLTADRIQSSFRLSVGWSTTEQDVDEALQFFRSALGRLPTRRTWVGTTV